ncbi:unnamed protein product [Pedinophyceae sp. YPF-701]|nr:unnamed protein product [Pedinophyceae sp. YPF-701]
MSGIAARSIHPLSWPRSFLPRVMSSRPSKRRAAEARGEGAEAHERTLFYVAGSMFAWRVLIALREKKIPFTPRLLSLEKGELKSQEVFEVNHRMQSPSFRDVGGNCVNESMAALQYLEDSYTPPTYPALLPPTSDPAARGHALQRLHEAAVLTFKQRAVRQSVFGMPPFEEIDITTEPGRTRHAELTTALIDEMRIWEKYLSEGAYAAGNEVTLADCVLATDLIFMRRLGCDFSVFPALERYVNAMEARETLRADWPPHWTKPAGEKWRSVFSRVAELAASQGEPPGP